MKLIELFDETGNTFEEVLLEYFVIINQIYLNSKVII